MTRNNQFSKDPDSDLDYQVNWTAWLGEDETITTSTWVVPDGLTVGTSSKAPSHDGTTATVWLSGGTIGARYDVVNRITTNQGRTEDRTLKLYITEH